MSIKVNLDLACGYFYDAYVRRWHEQKLTGSIVMKVNFFKGGISSISYDDTETKKLDELREEDIKFSHIET